MQVAVEGRQVYAATGGRPFDPRQPVVVFLHGAGCDHSVWQLPARWFAWHGHAVLAVDLPGHGRSHGPPLESVAALADWLRAVLDAARVDKAALIGHSMGGAIAVEAAAAYGERITRLALLGTAATIPVHNDLLAAARDTPERAYRMMTGWSHGQQAKIGGNPAPGLWMTGGTLALLARNQPDALHRDLSVCHDWKSGPEAARRVRSPALVMIAANDVMTPPKGGRELASLIAGSRTITIDRCGHMLLAEAPDAVLDGLIDFFANPGARGGDKSK